MSLDLLREAAAALYGPQWQSALARDLGVNGRTVRRWAAREFSPPARIYADLARLADARLVDLGKLRARLKKAGGE